MTILKKFVKTYRKLSGKAEGVCENEKSIRTGFLEKVANHAAQVKAMRDLRSKGKKGKRYCHSWSGGKSKRFT